MLFPTLEEVQQLAAQYSTIPVFYRFPADHLTPISLFAALSEGEENAVLLEGVNDGTIGIPLSDFIRSRRSTHPANGSPSGKTAASRNVTVTYCSTHCVSCLRSAPLRK